MHTNKRMNLFRGLFLSVEHNLLFQSFLLLLSGGVFLEMTAFTFHGSFIQMIYE